MKRDTFTVLLAPAHILVDELREGSEYNWPYKLIERLTLDHGVRVIALVVQSRVERDLPLVRFVSVDPGGSLPMSNIGRLRFHLRVYWAVRRILADGEQVDVVHHMLPFGFRATFNLYTLLRRRTQPPVLIGPLQSPLSYEGGDEARTAVRDFSAGPPDFQPARRSRPPLSTFVILPLLSTLSAFTLRRAAALVAISEQAARLYGSIIGTDLSIIPAGVDTHEFSPLERARANDMPDGEQRPIGLIAVGYLVRRKAFDVLIRAVARVIADGHRVHLRIIGDGPLRDQLQQLAVQLGVAEVVEFVGLVPHSEVAQEYHKADIFCSASLSESFSVVGLEAMACGLPLVATPTGYFREVLRRHTVGLAVRFADANSLADALVRLVSDRGLRERMGQQARAVAVAEYDWGVVATRYMAVYQRICGQSSRLEGRKM